MSYPARGPVFQQRPPQPMRNRWLVPCSVACGCAVLLAIVIAVSVIKLVRSGADTYKQAGVAADQFLTTLEKSGTEAAYAQMSKENHNEKVKESVFDTMEVLEKRHGHPVSHGDSQGFSFNTNNGVSTVRFSYQETFEKGAMPVQITLVSEGGQWRVVSFVFQP